MSRRISVIYFAKPPVASSALAGARAAVVSQIEDLLYGPVRSALTGGEAVTVAVEMKREAFPETVAGKNVNETPEQLLDEALQTTRAKLEREGMEVESQEKRVSNRTRSAKVTLKVRRRKV